MGWLLPSGNHLLWIRPQFQSIPQKYREAAQQAKAGNISILEAAVLATRWGDESAPVDTKTWFSVAYDPDNRFWVARCNADICQSFLRTRTGAAGMHGEQLWLESTGVRTEGPALALLHYQYATEGTPKLSGNAVRGMFFDSEGNQKDWAGRTRFVRQLDAAAMMPQERLMEMIDAAVRDKNFASEMKAQFGLLGDPTFLLTMAAVFGVFIGIGAGAYVLGGAAFAAAVSRLLGISMVAMQIKTYVDLFAELQRCCYSDKQSDFTKGGKVVQQILFAAVRDIALLVTMEGALAVGAKACAMLKGLFSKYAPPKWVEAAKSGQAEAQARVASVRARFWGYAAEHLLKTVPHPETLFRPAELRFLFRRSAKEREMILIREPSSDRMQWLEKLARWVEGKSTFLKAKSGTGWHGLLCVSRNGEVAEALAGQTSRPYAMGNLRGVFKEIDEIIAKNPELPSYELPIGKNCTDVNGKCFDWGKPDHPNTRNMADAKGYRLVDLGAADPSLKGKMLVIDPLGRPVVQDLDIGSLQKCGTPSAGSHLPKPKKGDAFPEDHFYNEEMMNWSINAEETAGTYNPFKHGGRGGSVRHRIEQGEKGWTPRLKDGTFKPEELYVFLPFRQGGWTSGLFKFEGWGEFEAFCKANHIVFPF